ncbi:hypothetical protein [Streptomyces sp. VRA16 Mangrove soil]|uniref:hypothetical protein n=1 Tax=Streptomyces sp. VRA16 Mangrove soil TaxID=2817434 RepID=UPI001A9F3B42|nr:hypothetical protein [Streptomyces sp. VRA16 Mangrove soil]MBO1333724.1 hypothetical protein [Streptomyces sp. VRA16 Mangrove soil]
MERKRPPPDTTALRGAHEKLLDAAATPGLGEAADGGWDADRILAHLLSADAATSTVALGVVAGSRPTFDNRIFLDAWNSERIIVEHPGRADLLEHVRRQAAVLCDITDQLGEEAAEVLVPTILLSNDALALDQPIPLASLISGLAENHVPAHTRQLLALRTAATAPEDAAELADGQRHPR